MNKRQTIRGVIAMACVASLICAPAAPIQAQSPPASTPSPGGGITNGLNPIETTLFAYRALASDVEAVSSEVGAVAGGKKVVIGTTPDVAAFTQWRAIMGQILLLDERAKRINGEIGTTEYKGAKQLPAAVLSVSVRHYPIQAKPDTEKVTLRVTVKSQSGPLSGPASAPVTVTANLPDGWTGQPAGDGWTCNATGISCSRSDTLQPGQSYSDILIAVKLPKVDPGKPVDPASQPYSITVSGGGSATRSTYDVLMPAKLRIIKTPLQNQAGGIRGFSVTVINDPVPLAGSTNGVVRVTETLPPGRSLKPSPENPTGISGDGWDCSGITFTCLRSDPLGSGGSYPAILVTTDMQAGEVNQVTVSGGGSELPATAKVKVPEEESAEAAESALPQPSETVQPGGGSGGGAFSAITGALPAIVSLGQFLASAFAVTQTLAPSQISMTDLPLMNMMARQLRHSGVQAVYIPSIYTPDLLRNGNLNDTFIWKALSRLEADRREMWATVAKASGKLGRASFVVQNPTRYSQVDLNKALAYSAKIQSLISAAVAVAAGIDSFEASLFGGSAPAQPQQSSPTPAPSTSPSNTPAPAANTAMPQTSTPAPTAAAAPAQTPQAPSTQQSSPQTAASPSPSGGSGASVLPQILASDLLAQALCGSLAACWDPTDLKATMFRLELTDVNFLAVHALESGGTQLNKSNLFYGTHIFFSGGAVMTFALYKVTGDVSCSGLAYDYEGNVREKHYDRALRLPQLPAMINTDFACVASGTTATKGLAVRKGMTTHQVLDAAGAGVPHRVLGVKGKVYTYEFEDADHTRVVFRDGVVIKVMKKKKEAH